jgi:hypothetical protein
MTNLELINLSLSVLGEYILDEFPKANNRISSIIQNVYSSSYEKTLYDHAFQETIKTDVIASSSVASSGSIYGVAYDQPADCLYLLSVNENLVTPGDNYEMMNNQILVNDSGPISIKYVRNDLPLEQHTFLFLECFKMNLAINACVSITNNMNMRNDLISLYENQILPRSRFKNDYNQNFYRKRPLTRWGTARYSGTK